MENTCETSLQLKWSKNCILVAGTAANQNPEFQITDTKTYVLLVTLWTEDDIKPLQQLESGFKRTINWNEYLPKRINQARNRYLDFLINPSFQGVNRPFVLSFKDDDSWENHKQYYLPTVEIKDYNVMIDGRSFFDQPIKNDLRTYDNIRKIETGQSDGYATGCLLDYPYFKKHYKSIAKDLSKQQNVDADPKAIQQINFTRNIDRAENTTMFFIAEEAKESVLDFSKGTVKVLWPYFIII